ncbi:origin recognition complex subunit 2 [Coniophora puteana RWD-64-598 SS2]|uniref:Origin recognition complex subunit 2 n=1 Tax=Coniophora puteana (strain RWD-64-598) TaxID=741705 RepID=A0A5M3MCL1_CONPW|nr:origin recognition complex subunit 2 [Coniophora puteana RWD-64-598 SS2]EIW76580.1 origin recognition complex subunit 2 [Coniophora puteana RWD-64-598 SS2]
MNSSSSDSSDGEHDVYKLPAASAWDTDGPTFVPTSFDAYFAHAAARSQTSNNRFSNEVLPLTQQEYADALRSQLKREAAHPQRTAWAGPGPHAQQTALRRFAHELDEGFSLLFYGVGSKRNVLNMLATQVLSKRGHVVVINAFAPRLGVRDVLDAIERVPGLADAPFPPSNTGMSGADAQLDRIDAFFAPENGQKPLYLVVHNIDSPAARAPRVRPVFARLARHPRIYLAASIDRSTAPLLWPASEALARPPQTLSTLPTSRSSPHRTSSRSSSTSSSHTPSASTRPPPRPAYAFLYHDLTTLEPYDHELAPADRSSLAGASALSSGGPASALTAAAAGANAGPMSDVAAKHVLAAVTNKARQLFILLAKQQLEAMEMSAGEDASDAAAAAGGGSGGAGGGMAELEKNGMPRDSLFERARNAFLAMDDTAFRALLGEFRDHGLVRASAPQSGTAGSVLWIPMRAERLRKVLRALEEECGGRWIRGEGGVVGMPSCVVLNVNGAVFMFYLLPLPAEVHGTAGVCFKIILSHQHAL